MKVNKKMSMKKIDLSRLKNWKEVGTQKTTKRFDYKKIRDELVKLGDAGQFVTMGIVKRIMQRYDSKGGVIWYNQIRQCIERLDARADTQVLVDPDASPRLYLFRSVKERSK